MSRLTLELAWESILRQLFFRGTFDEASVTLMEETTWDCLDQRLVNLCNKFSAKLSDGRACVVDTLVLLSLDDVPSSKASFEGGMTIVVRVFCDEGKGPIPADTEVTLEPLSKALRYPIKAILCGDNPRSHNVRKGSHPVLMDPVEGILCRWPPILPDFNANAKLTSGETQTPKQMLVGGQTSALREASAVDFKEVTIALSPDRCSDELNGYLRELRPKEGSNGLCQLIYGIADDGIISGFNLSVGTTCLPSCGQPSTDVAPCDKCRLALSKAFCERAIEAAVNMPGVFPAKRVFISEINAVIEEVDSTPYVPGNGTGQRPYRLRMSRTGESLDSICPSDGVPVVTASSLSRDPKKHTKLHGKWFQLDMHPRTVISFQWKLVPDAIIPVVESKFLVHPAFTHYRINQKVLDPYWISQLQHSSPLWSNDPNAVKYLSHCENVGNATAVTGAAATLLYLADTKETAEEVFVPRDVTRIILFGRCAPEALEKLDRTETNDVSRVRINLMAIASLDDLPFVVTSRLPMPAISTNLAFGMLPGRRLFPDSAQSDQQSVVVIDSGSYDASRVNVLLSKHAIVAGSLLIAPAFSPAPCVAFKCGVKGATIVVDCRMANSAQQVQQLKHLLAAAHPAVTWEVETDASEDIGFAARCEYLKGCVAKICRGCTIERAVHNELVRQLSAALKSDRATVFHTQRRTRCSGTTTSILSAFESLLLQQDTICVLNLNSSSEATEAFFSLEDNRPLLLHVTDVVACEALKQAKIHERPSTAMVLDFPGGDPTLPGTPLIVPNDALTDTEIEKLVEVFQNHSPGREQLFRQLGAWMKRADDGRHDGRSKAEVALDRHLIHFSLTFARGEFLPLSSIAENIANQVKLRNWRRQFDEEFLVHEAFAGVPGMSMIPSQSIVTSGTVVEIAPRRYRMLHPMIAFLVLRKMQLTALEVASAAIRVLESSTAPVARAMLIDRPKGTAFSRLVGWLFETCFQQAVEVVGFAIITYTTDSDHYRILLARLYLRRAQEGLRASNTGEAEADAKKRFVEAGYHATLGLQICQSISDSVKYMRERTIGFLRIGLAYALAGQKENSEAAYDAAMEAFAKSAEGGDKEQQARSERVRAKYENLRQEHKTEPYKEFLPELYADFSPAFQGEVAGEED